MSARWASAVVDNDQIDVRPKLPNAGMLLDPQQRS
jgi:hypothetical protein